MAENGEAGTVIPESKYPDKTSLGGRLNRSGLFFTPTQYRRLFQLIRPELPLSYPFRSIQRRGAADLAEQGGGKVRMPGLVVFRQAWIIPRAQAGRAFVAEGRRLIGSAQRTHRGNRQADLRQALVNGQGGILPRAEESAAVAAEPGPGG